MYQNGTLQKVRYTSLRYKTVTKGYRTALKNETWYKTVHTKWYRCETVHVTKSYTVTKHCVAEQYTIKMV
jgi:hypothetical protein